MYFFSHRMFYFIYFTWFFPLRMTVMSFRVLMNSTPSVVKPSWQTRCDSTSFICIHRLAVPRSIQLSRLRSVSSPTMHAGATVSVLQMLG